MRDFAKRWAVPGRGTLPALLVLGLFAGLSAPASGAESAGALVFAQEALAIEVEGTVHPFTVEVARTPEQLAQGLMFRLDLAPDAGMLFDFGSERPVSMWMKNTLIPLDMLFVSNDGRIVRVHANATPLSLEDIPSGGPVRAVIELPGGTAERLHIRQGDRVRHPLFGSPAAP